jgi:RsiW-degrading membrane proteinase PrsW (M82 family)
MTAALEAPSVSTPARVPVIYRPGSAVFWVFVAALAIGTGVQLAANGAAIKETLDAQVALAPLWLLFIAFLIWLMFKFDPYRSVRAYPQVLVAGAALGATAAVTMAMEGNTAMFAVWDRVLDPDVATRWSAALSAPFIEEAAKAVCAAVLLVLAAGVFNRISHALLLGMFVGFGFDVSEDLMYAAREAINSLDSDVSGAGSNLVLRVFTAVPAHWAYTALATVGVLLLLPTFAGRDNWSWPRRIIVAAGLMFSASLMHFIWDSPGPDEGGVALLAMLLKVAVNLVIFLVPVLFLLRSERAWVHGRIGNAATGLPFDRAVLESLRTGKARRQLQKDARRSGGRAAKKAVRRQQRAALDHLQAG